MRAKPPVASRMKCVAPMTARILIIDDVPANTRLLGARLGAEIEVDVPGDAELSTPRRVE